MATITGPVRHVFVPAPQVDAYYLGFRASGGTSIAGPTMSNVVEWAIPIVVVEPLRVKAFVVDRRTASAGGLLYRLGLRANSNGTPGSLIKDGGTVAADVGAGATSIVETTVFTAIALPSGLYWGMISTNGAGVLEAYAAQVALPIQYINSGGVLTPIYMVYRAIGAATPPAAFAAAYSGATYDDAAACIQFGLKISA